MREPGKSIDRRAAEVVDSALAVHRALGPGYLESVYEEALCCELTDRAIPFQRQVAVGVSYKGRKVGQGVLDLLIDDRLVVELKAVELLAPIHGIQVRSYLKATGLQLGLLINFNVVLLKAGIRRIISTAR